MEMIFVIGTRVKRIKYICSYDREKETSTKLKYSNGL